MAKEATREGVSPEEQGEQVERQTLERDNALEAIAARRAQEIETPEDEEEKDAPEEQEEETPEAAQEEEEPAETLKIDGQEQKVPLSKIMDAGKRALQKELAADKRLEEATRLQKDLERQQQEIQRYQQWMATQGRAVQQPSQEDAFKERVKGLREAILYGDEEQGNAAMVEMMRIGAMMAAPQISQVEQKIALQRHNEAIAQTFASEYQDIASDPELYQVATALVDSRRNMGDTRNDWNFYKEVGDYVRNLAKRTGQPAAPIDIQARQEKKRVADKVPTLSARAVGTHEKEPTRDDILAEMRSRRAS